jgi:hypothetical protein
MKLSEVIANLESELAELEAIDAWDEYELIDHILGWLRCVTEL